MMIIPDSILRFIQDETVMSLTTSGADGAPWCCNCFYVFDPSTSQMIFRSEMSSLHIRHILQRPTVAGTIYRTGETINEIRGVQFRGRVFAVKEPDLKQARLLYVKRIPMGDAVNAPFWALRLQYIKMTDNSLGFGKKIICGDSGLSSF